MLNRLILIVIISSIAFVNSYHVGNIVKQQRMRSSNALELSMTDRNWNQRDILSENPFSDISNIQVAAVEKNHEQFLTTLMSATAALLLFTPEPSIAQGGAYGIFEAKAASLLHPITMYLLFGTTIYSGILGLQWRKLRELPAAIKALNEKLPVISTGKVSSPLTPEISRITNEISILQGNEDNDTPLKLETLKKDLTLLQNSIELDNQIIKLTSERKELLNGNVRDKHWLTGSILLGVGVSVSILGAFNTYMRTGKLFPGPHLYAGMGITILYAVAAALVPSMQKGNEASRIAHIGLNTINVGLFAWQLLTGTEILGKVWEKVPW